MKRLALITGGNRGIGSAAVELLALKGFDVLLACRDPAAGEAVAKPLRARGLSVDVFTLNVAALQPADLIALARRPIDVLVNNAGFYPKPELNPATLRDALEVHVLGPLTLCQALLPGMKGRGYGRIVNLSSGHGSFSEGLEGPLAYSVSKAALNALTVKLSQDAGPHVKVNALCPGWVRTRMGGEAAPVPATAAAENILYLATLPPEGPTGGFFRDRRRIAF
jgi:NAD(P)-dependent dehydrogenase (short-subunit alcohol dehydrogenase family)